MSTPSKPLCTVIRRRVSVAGRVMRKGGVPACGGSVSIDDGVVRQQTSIRSDGLYFCLDLPAGKHVLGGVDERGCVIEARSVKVPAVSDRPGGSPLLGIDLVATDTPQRRTHPPP
jgi:hypothetical protein